MSICISCIDRSQKRRAHSRHTHTLVRFRDGHICIMMASAHRVHRRLVSDAPEESRELPCLSPYWSINPPNCESVNQNRIVSLPETLEAKHVLTDSPNRPHSSTGQPSSCNTGALIFTYTILGFPHYSYSIMGPKT